MEKINIAKLLKDCPKGMELDCVIYENLYFDCIREHPIYPIVCYTVDSKGRKNETSFNWYGRHAPIDTAKCVIFPKGKTTWEGFQRPFKDGDIVTFPTENHPQIFIFKDKKENNTRSSCYLMLDGDELILGEDLYYVTRHATDEEKRKLFDAIKDNGYEWDPETKILEKLVEPKFKVGDWVTDGISKCQVHFIDDTQYWYSENCILGSIESVDKQYHLWTIEDAKDGDVIFYDDGWTCIFKCIHGIWYSSYCFMTYDGKFHMGYEEHTVDAKINGNSHPATKEQCNFLFQKMKEAGYEWNPETKTLEKLIEPKFKVGDVIQDIDSYKVKITEVNIEDECYGYESVISKGIGGIGFNEQDNWELVPNKFDINTLVPFESKVLIRNDETQKWIPAFWGYKPEHKYVTTFGVCNYCIPYEGNQHLLSTNNDCDDFYKTWEE